MEYEINQNKLQSTKIHSKLPQRAAQLSLSYSSSVKFFNIYIYIYKLYLVQEEILIKYIWKIRRNYSRNTNTRTETWRTLYYPWQPILGGMKKACSPSLRACQKINVGRKTEYPYFCLVGWPVSAPSTRAQTNQRHWHKCPLCPPFFKGKCRHVLFFGYDVGQVLGSNPMLSVNLILNTKRPPECVSQTKEIK